MRLRWAKMPMDDWRSSQCYGRCQSQRFAGGICRGIRVYRESGKEISGLRWPTELYRFRPQNVGIDTDLNRLLLNMCSFFYHLSSLHQTGSRALNYVKAHQEGERREGVTVSLRRGAGVLRPQCAHSPRGTSGPTHGSSPGVAPSSC